jgi:hypothetical protein
VRRSTAEVVRGFGAAKVVGGGLKRKAGAFKGGEAGDCGAQLREGIPGSFAGDLGRKPVRGRKA